MRLQMPRLQMPLLHLNFLSIHLLYILGCSLLAFLILASFGNISTLDAFFFAVSASTESGMNVVDVKDLNLAQQLVIYIFPVITNPSFINILVVYVRLRWFKKRLEASVLSSLKKCISASSERYDSSRTLLDYQCQAQDLSLNQPTDSVQLLVSISQDSTATSASSVSENDYDKLGGIQYRSLKLLLKIINGLHLGLHALGVICLLPWILLTSPYYREMLASSGQNPVWWAFYTSQSMISNVGFTLTTDSMIGFREASYPMVLLTFLAFAGNTCHPIILRFLIWIMYRVTARGSRMNDELRFLLENPRKCYTLLFPSRVTWLLFDILFIMNTIDILLIVFLDWDNPEVNHLPIVQQLIAATFQAASTRHTGTSTFNLAKISPAVQFSLLIMMYVSVFPIAVSVRSSNTYGHATLGIFATESEPEDTAPTSTYLLQHVRDQLGYDLWYIFLSTFIVCMAEAQPMMDPDKAAFTVFSVLFECLSAYSNVGLSLGTDTTMTSLAGECTALSKVVLCLLM